MLTSCTKLENEITINNQMNELLKEAFFFDIETTGLSPKNSAIISITTLLNENNSFYIYQIFCEYGIDEKEAIKYFFDLVNKKKFVITYNGNSFDIPFIINKAQDYKVLLNFDKFIKIDLYRDMRNLRKKFSIDSLKLKSVEQHFKIKRNDTITGQDVTILYEAYRIEPKKEFSTIILQHNYEDVYNLPILLDKIMNLYDYIILYNDIAIKINYYDFVIKKNMLIGSFNIITTFKHDFIAHSLNYDIKIDIKSQIMEIKIPVNHYSNIDIKEFYYLNNDDFHLKNYTIISGIKKNIIPLKFNDKLCNNNFVLVVKNILNSILDIDMSNKLK